MREVPLYSSSGRVSIEYGTHKTVTARFWPWHKAKVLKTYSGVPSSLGSVLTEILYGIRFNFNHLFAISWEDSTVTYVNRYSTFALRRSSLDFCLGGQRSLRAAQRATRTILANTQRDSSRELGFRMETNLI